jgi:hypothetical protein
MDRYPAEFAAARQFFAGRKSVKILSYGCSTGEEVLTLRRYFPHAAIVGAEINPVRLAKCRSLAVDDGITFIPSEPVLLEKHAPFDAIFCMAVLQRRPHLVIENDVRDISRFYPFKHFDRAVCFLSGILKPGGLLGLEHSQYLLRDSTVFGQYESLTGFPLKVPESPRFGPDGRRLDRPPLQSTLFIKKIRHVHWPAVDEHGDD